jgi:carbon-monoxide dehydrogenase medium subunit
VISREIEFHAPAELSAVLDLLATRGDEVTLLSGGMSLLPMMNLGLAEPDVIVSLNHLNELQYIREEGGSLHIGAATPHVQLGTEPHVRRVCPALADAALAIGDVQVRNRGTIGGSVAHADPAADYLPVLALVGAEIGLRSAGQTRHVLAPDFFLDLMYTARQPNELVAEVVIPSQMGGARMAFEKFARVEGSFAIVNAAARVDRGAGSAAVALGGVGPRPVIVDVFDQMGSTSDREAVDAAGERAYEASSGAVGDVFADSEYRREMARVFARRALAAAMSDGSSS